MDNENSNQDYIFNGMKIIINSKLTYYNYKHFFSSINQHNDLLLSHYRTVEGQSTIVMHVTCVMNSTA